jgi:DNA-directed RNA polymerase specialized sigma24 family protein
MNEHPSSPDAFRTTRWTLVREAHGESAEARAALSELCTAYYAPVQAYIARTSRDLGDVGDLAGGFFARILAGSLLGGAARERGRFRAYLLGAVKHFLADTRDRLATAKRGGQAQHVALDAGTDTSGGVNVVAESPAPDTWFDRQWGIAVLDQALTTLAAEHEAQGKGAHFRLLKPWLTGGADTTQAEAAASLDITEGAFKVAVHRLRHRFRELVKAHIAQTVSTEEELRDEIRYLIEVVS